MWGAQVGDGALPRGCSPAWPGPLVGLLRRPRWTAPGNRGLAPPVKFRFHGAERTGLFTRANLSGLDLRGAELDNCVLVEETQGRFCHFVLAQPGKVAKHHKETSHKQGKMRMSPFAQPAVENKGSKLLARKCSQFLADGTGPVWLGSAVNQKRSA